MATDLENIYGPFTGTEAADLQAWLDALAAVRTDPNTAVVRARRNIKVPLADFLSAYNTGTVSQQAGAAVWARGNPEVKFT